MEIEVDGKKYNIKCEHAGYEFIFKAYNENNELAAFTTATLSKTKPMLDALEKLLYEQAEKLKLAIHNNFGK